MIKNISFVRQAGWLSRILIIAVLAGCGKSIPTPATDAITPAMVTLQGQLMDAVTGEAIVGARIDIGLKTAITDSNGHYEMANVPANNAAGNGVTRDYQATITLTGVTSPVNMTDAAATPRYPDSIFKMPMIPSGAMPSANHDFRVGKLSAAIRGTVGDNGLLTLGGATVELQDNTTGRVGTLLRSTTSDAVTGEYVFANVEAGVDYLLFGRTGDGAMQGAVAVGRLYDGQTLTLSLGGTPALLLNSTDTYSPRIIGITPENNADVAPGEVNVVFVFNEPIRQNAYSIPNPSMLDNIYHDINVSYGGKKAAGNYAHTLTWNATFDTLTINLPATGTSSRFTVDLSLLSPLSATALGKLMDNAGNGLENSAVLTAGNLLSFTTNGGMLAAPPVILSPDAPGLDSNAASVTLDWQPVLGATKGYNIYRSTRNNLAAGVVEPFVLLAGPIIESTYTDTLALSGFTFLPSTEVVQSYAYRVTSINSDLIESMPSNELLIKDVINPSVLGTAGICVAPGGISLTVPVPGSVTANGQVKFTFSEPLDVIAAETTSNYLDNTGAIVGAAKLTTPTTLVLDFTAPITCANTNTVTIGTGITDVAGNALTGTLAQRTLTYMP